MKNNTITSMTTDTSGNYYLTGNFGTSPLTTGLFGSMYYGKFDGYGNPIWLKQKGNTESAYFKRIKR
ncbi:hypothetical protein ABGT15_02975 [Flavobacterium enshiense]|uniref:hypothetical protein n=1 Tax=Flavobacterium enshiense TaxID=1341165 RepID=UPI00345DA371